MLTKIRRDSGGVKTSVPHRVPCTYVLGGARCRYGVLPMSAFPAHTPPSTYSMKAQFPQWPRGLKNFSSVFCVLHATLHARRHASTWGRNETPVGVGKLHIRHRQASYHWHKPCQALTVETVQGTSLRWSTVTAPKKQDLPSSATALKVPGEHRGASLFVNTRNSAGEFPKCAWFGKPSWAR